MIKRDGGDEVLLEWRDGRIAVITINRPHRRNACNGNAWSRLQEAFAAACRERSTRLVVLTGAGGYFCAGDDIHDGAPACRDAQSTATYLENIEKTFASVTEATVPVVAAISGYCIGGGLSLAMCCDFRVATRQAELGIPAAKLGFSYPAAQCARLMSLVGISRARKMLFEGSRVDGQKAFEIGLIDALAEANPVDAAVAFCADMLDCAPLSVRASKMIFQALSEANMETRRAEIERLQHLIPNSHDAGEGASAFAQKRYPQFKGR